MESIPGACVIARVGGPELQISEALSVPVSGLTDAYEGSIPAAFA